MNALVLGAGGFLGLNLVDEMRAEGLDPLCARRTRTNVIPLRSRRARMVHVDLDEPDSLVAAMAGVDVVFHAAGHYPRHSQDGFGAMEVGLRQLENVLDAAAAADVRRLVYVSSTATVAASPRGLSDESDTFAGAPGLGVYHDLKWYMERRATRERRFEVRVACPGACVGPWDLRVGTSALVVAAAHNLDVPHPDGIVAVVDAADAARGILRLGTLADAPARVLLVGGNHRLHALRTALAERYGGPPPSPPIGAAEAIALADAEERRALREGGRGRLSREIVDLIVHGVPIDASLSARTLGLAYAPLADTLDRFDAWARRMRIIPPLENVA
ncbi:MAG: NAD-dependent epimerase/dehydratase family protein [Pseudomonadota bacterium]|nr:NAD-dependent epimerase/dehydratase family protein [Pseudomonadota bacterium]